MPKSPLAAIVGRLVRALPPTDRTADAALLARFIGWQDEAAFELLVYRHGPMVRGLCRRVLRHEQDAEDAFQATFLALAKKAATVRGQSLPGWLYRVAFHAALKAKAKRVPCPPLWVGMGSDQPMPTQSGRHGTPDSDPASELEIGELRAALDEEVLRLPERFRLPVVLCYLQGRSNREAAVALGIPKGTVDSRLATARQRLRDRLLRRGLAPAIGGAAIDRILDSVADAAILPGSVARAVAKSAVAFVSNQSAAGVVPAAAANLAEGVLHTMFVTKIKWAMATMLTVAMLGSGAGVATYEAVAGDGPQATPAKSTVAQAVADPVKDQHELAAQIRKPVVTGFAALCTQVEQTISIERMIDGSPLNDVLVFLSDKYGITFLVDTHAFELDGVGGGRNVGETQIRLPVMPNVTLSTVLRFLLAQVDGTCLVRRDHIEITTRRRQTIEAFGPEESRAFDFLPPAVNVVFEGRPFEKALAELAGQTGKNVLLDPRVQDKEKLVVTARLLNTPIDAAVLVVSDMVGLQPVTIGNIYYVTTKDNAERLHKQELLKSASGSPPAKPTPPAAKQ